MNLGSGAGLVAQGAWIDRRGQSGGTRGGGPDLRRVAGALAAAVARGGPAWLTAALAFAGGASLPATPTAVRALCATLVHRPAAAVTPYAMLHGVHQRDTPRPAPGLVLLAGGPRRGAGDSGPRAATGTLYAWRPRRAASAATSAPRWRLSSLATPGCARSRDERGERPVLGWSASPCQCWPFSRHDAALAGETGRHLRRRRSCRRRLLRRPRMAPAAARPARSRAAGPRGELRRPRRHLGDLAAVAVGMASSGRQKPSPASP